MESNLNAAGLSNEKAKMWKYNRKVVELLQQTVISSKVAKEVEGRNYLEVEFKTGSDELSARSRSELTALLLLSRNEKVKNIHVFLRSSPFDFNSAASLPKNEANDLSRRRLIWMKTWIGALRNEPIKSHLVLEGPTSETDKQNETVRALFNDIGARDDQSAWPSVPRAAVILK